MPFTLTAAHLERLCTINAFPVSSDPLSFFGIRGCLPLVVDDQSFRPEAQLEIAAFDHRHPRCVIGQPFDNIHAAWCQGVSHADFARAGCQVIVGYPKCVARNGQPAIGPWATFHKNAYALAQKGFHYLLFNGREVQQVAAQDLDAAAPAKLRFGSQGSLVEKLQKALEKAGFYEGILDGDFGDRTIRALLAFQRSAFGPQGDDGIAGPLTAAALGMQWPTV